MQRITSFLLASLFVAAIALPSAVRAELQAGTAVVDITPQQWPLAPRGSFTPRPMDSAHDPLHVRCLVLDDGNDEHRAGGGRQLHGSPRCAGPGQEPGFGGDRHSGGTHADLRDAHPFRPFRECSTRHAAGACLPEAASRRHCRSDRPGFAESATGASGLVELRSSRRGLQPPLVSQTGHRSDQSLRRRHGHREDESAAKQQDPHQSGRPDRSGSSRCCTSKMPKDGRSQFSPTTRSITSATRATRCRRTISVNSRDSCRSALASPAKGFVAMMSNGTSGDINNINFRNPRPRREPFEQIRIVASKTADAAATGHPANRRPVQRSDSGHETAGDHAETPRADGGTDRACKRHGRGRRRRREGTPASGQSLRATNAQTGSRTADDQGARSDGPHRRSRDLRAAV